LGLCQAYFGLPGCICIICVYSTTIEGWFELWLRLFGFCFNSRQPICVYLKACLYLLMHIGANETRLEWLKQPSVEGNAKNCGLGSATRERRPCFSVTMLIPNRSCNVLTVVNKQIMYGETRTLHKPKSYICSYICIYVYT
jgi:hypothetical protein